MEHLRSQIQKGGEGFCQFLSGDYPIRAEQIAAGLPGDGASLQPNYLRLSQAERERLEKQNKGE